MGAKKLICFLIIGTLILPIKGLFAQSHEVPGALRILTYNIYHGATRKNDFNLDLIAGVIQSDMPDLAALQEVDFKTNRAKGMDLATELGYRLKMASLFGQAMEYDGGGYGEGILSHFPIIYSLAHPLPHSPGKEPRTALEIRVIIPSGDTIAFIGTHLDHTHDPADRLAQASMLNKIVSKIPYPTVLAGDLNATPDSEVIGILSQNFAFASSDLAPTFPSDNPHSKIDYILLYPKSRWKVSATKVIDEKVASDHRPFAAVISLLPEKQ